MDGYAAHTWAGSGRGLAAAAAANGTQIPPGMVMPPGMQLPPDSYFFNGGAASMGAATMGSSMMFTTGATGENSTQMSIDSGSKRTHDLRSDKKAMTADKKKFGGDCPPSVV